MTTRPAAERVHIPGIATLADIPAFHANHQPDRTALVCAGRRIDYRELELRSVATAAALIGDGARPGDRIGFLGQESIEFYVTIFACARAKLILVPINFRLTTPEIDHIIADSGCRLLIADPDLMASVPNHLTPRTSTPDAFTAWGADAAERPLETVRPDDPAVILYTSGTTGLPKGVVLPHRSFFAIRNLLAAAEPGWIDWYPDDVALVGIPGLHVGGLWWATQAFAAGATVVAMPRFDAGQATGLIRQEAVTAVCVVPAMLQQMLDTPRRTGDSFATVRTVIYGGSPITTALLEKAMAAFGCEFGQIYGLTETGNTACFLPPSQHRPGSARLRAAGRTYPGVRAKIIDDNGAELPEGDVGEICLHTPAAMLRYWNRPDATAATLRDGWIHTGDSGYLYDGYVFVGDRIKDMIIVGGENVYPAEVENAIASHPMVADVAVIGIPDDTFGERVVAVVIGRDGEQPATRSLFDHCRQRLAGFKIPTRFILADDIPRNPSGKILRRLLVSRYSDSYSNKYADERTVSQT